MTASPVPRISVTGLVHLLAQADDPTWLVHATDGVAFRDRHLPGAVHLPSGAILRQIARTARIVVYGEDSHARAAERLAVDLHHLGSEVVWFAGGLAAWEAAGLPVEGRGPTTDP